MNHGALLPQLLGLNLDDVYGHRIGRLDGAYLDTRTDEVEWLVVRVGVISPHHYAVPLEGLVVGGGHAWIPEHRGTVRSSHEVRFEEPLTRAHDRKLLHHYARAYGKRWEALQGRGPLVSCVPADLVPVLRPREAARVPPAFASTGPRIPAVERRRALNA